MANNEIKTNAEIYREQRKERLAKAAKKKKSGKSDRIVRGLVKTVIVLLIVAAICLAAGNAALNVFCLPQKVLTAASYNGDKVTVAEYNYYYMALYNQVYQYASYYDSNYGAGYGKMYTGFDYTVSPADQDYPTTESEEVPEGVKTWADYFKEMASVRALLMKNAYAKATSDEAKAQGFEITDEKMKEINDSIDETIKTLTENAQKNNFSVDNYIARVCGEGLNEKKYTELCKQDAIAQEYLSWYQNESANDLSLKEVKAYYNKHVDDFATVTARAFAFSYLKETDEETGKSTQAYTKAEAKAYADEFAAKITDEASFKALAKEYFAKSKSVTEEDIASYSPENSTSIPNYTKSQLVEAQMAEKLADWFFDKDRAAGDKFVYHNADEKVYYVTFMVAPAAPDKSPSSASVRHILFNAATTTTDDDGNSINLDDATIAKNEAAAKKKADAVLAEWKKGEATEESFAALAKEKTEDTGSAETGGLYEDINASSNYVPEFLDWSLAEHKAGDTGIIKTQYGYHVMYYVKGDSTPKWQTDVRTAIANADYEEYVDGLYEEINSNIDKNEKVTDFFADRMLDMLNKNIANSASDAAAASVAV